jgi:hypothetical protein
MVKSPSMMALQSPISFGTLRFLRKVSRFSSDPRSHVDIISRNALFRTANHEQRLSLLEATALWYRPAVDKGLLKEGLMRYGDEPPPRSFSGDYLSVLFSTMRSFAPSERIIPLSTGAACAHPDFPRSTSPGFPYRFDSFRTKGDVIDQLGPGHFYSIWDQIGRGVPYQLPDSMAFTRPIASEKTKTKQRPVWGYPLDVIVEEARYFFPLFQHLKLHAVSTDSCYGLGMETALGGHDHLRRVSASIPGAKVLCSDISSFDAHVPGWVIRDIFSLMSDWFDFSKIRSQDGSIWDVDPVSTARRWRAMVSYFVTTKIRLPDGLRFQKFGGVPSGSMFTNVIDTFVNAVQMRTCLRRLCGNPARDYYYGDDSVIFLFERQVLDLVDLEFELLSTFGAILSTAKTVFTNNIENVHWLGYYCRPDGPSRSPLFILASTMFPEREVVSPVDSCARLLGQLYSTMHPTRCLWFLDAVRDIQLRYSVTDLNVVEYIRSMPSKAMKFLTTLGYGLDDIVVPAVVSDLDGSRLVPSVMPRPCARAFTSLYHEISPPYIFVPECYANSVLRQHFLSKSFDYLDCASPLST